MSSFKVPNFKGSAGRPTIDDVAALSGVARATVSRALNGGPNVSADVRARVARAVTELDYQVNMQARALAGGKARKLVLIYAMDPLGEVNSFYHMGLELGALRACGEAGLHLMMQGQDQTSGAAAADILGWLDAEGCVGAILTPPFSDDAGLVAAIVARQLPIVCVAPGAPVRGLAGGVGIDEAQASYDLTRHLLSLGHQRFGFIKGHAGHLSAEDRYAGFVRALSDACIAADSVVCARGNFTFRSGVERSAEILAGASRPSALICANDDMATGALFTAYRMGLDVPRDLSVAGFDDTPMSGVVWPPLTTVHQPLQQMGCRAVERIVADLKAVQRGAEPAAARFEAVPHRVVVRGSAARPAV